MGMMAVLAAVYPYERLDVANASRTGTIVNAGCCGRCDRNVEIQIAIITGNLQRPDMVLTHQHRLAVSVTLSLVLVISSQASNALTLAAEVRLG
jgi:hypothetical protein